MLIKMKKLLFLLLIACTSCSLFDGMKKRSFEYENAKFLSLLVPKGYKKAEVKADNDGNKVHSFSYGNEASLYFAFGDTTKEYQPIDSSMNIAKFYPGDVLFYKGQDYSNRLFWRESRYKSFRFGYRNISAERESEFDYSLNYAASQILKTVN